MESPDKSQAQKPLRSHFSTKPLAYVVAGFLGVIALAALGSAVHLTAMIIRIPDKDGTLLAVYVGLVGQAYAISAASTAGLIALLSNVNKPQDPTPMLEPAK